MKTFLLLLSTLFYLSAGAQSHTFKQCYLNKQWASAKKDTENWAPSCSACVEKRKKEHIARQQEIKKRAEIATAKFNAEKLAKQKAFEAEWLKKQEEAKKAKSGEVLINAQPSKQLASGNKTQTKPSVKQTNYFYNVNGGINTTNNFHRFFYDQHNGFIVNKDTVLNHNEFANCLGVCEQWGSKGDLIMNSYNFPPNVGIVRLKESKIVPPGNGRNVANNYPIADLVDLKGNRLLKDDNITAIIHFVDDYFLIAKGSYMITFDKHNCNFDEVEIYNYKTKQSYPLQRKTYTDINWSTVDISREVNTNGYSFRNDKLKPKGSYKAFIVTETLFRNYTVYYITNDGKIELQQITN